MVKTFNCGVGFCLISKRKNLNQIKRLFEKNYQPYEIGFVSRDKKNIKISGKIIW